MCCINWRDGVCFLCKKKRKLQTHHILRIPDITINVCKDCHKIIDETDNYPELKPELSRKQKRLIKWIYKNKDILDNIDWNMRGEI